MSILLVDDHTLFREGLESLLRTHSGVRVVGSAGNGEEAITLARELMPDLILMDVRMPGVSGLEATRRITEEMPAMRVVMLTMSEDDHDLFEAIKNGAQGYLLKTTASDELYHFLEGAMEGESPISGVMATKMLGEFKHPASESKLTEFPCEKLTEREYQVLFRLAEGMKNREIAAALFISESTVKKHLRNILAKLHLQNRVQAALFAREQHTTNPRT
ncbi:MAG: response regulator transcription factor [Anaerolineales bacterium]|nr:response regulator transcription factor [Anaerolineales bacterium]